MDANLPLLAALFFYGTLLFAIYPRWLFFPMEIPLAFSISFATAHYGIEW